MSINAADLPALAVQKRAAAVAQFNKDNDEYLKLEAEADELYAMAREHGLEFFEVPRYDALPGRQTKKRTKPCVTCGNDFVYRNSRAKYCSEKCSKRAQREAA